MSVYLPDVDSIGEPLAKVVDFQLVVVEVVFGEWGGRRASVRENEVLR